VTRASASPAGDPAKLALVQAYCADAERLLLAHRLAEARKTVQQALRLAPRHAAATNILGVVEMESGNLEAAAAALGRAAALAPQAPEPRYFLGLALARLGRPEAALEALGAALALKADLRPALRALSDLLQSLGRKAEATAAIRRLLALDPGDVTGLYQLARHDRAALTAADKARLEAAAEGGTAPASTACLALAEIHDAEGDADKAFLYLKRGNDMVHRALARNDGRAPAAPALGQGPAPRRMAPQQALADMGQRSSFAQLVFNEAFLAQHAGLGHASSLPIFILGMPRSGSTLIEQILASHPQVHGAGELDAAEKSLVEMRWPYEGYLQQGPESLPQAMARFSPPPRPAHRYFRELGAGYVKALRAHSARARRITDKMPINYLYIGMIHLCLPKAVILHSVRDPLDTCLSCYWRPFTSGYETSYDLTLLGQHYRLYRQVMAHWDRLLPGRVIDVVYERLVADPEAEIRRLLAACGLPWDDACLSFHETRRPVGTASASQVREPIFTRGVGRWRRYEAHLGPLIEALGPYAPGSADATGTGAAQKEERGS
jgi:tetratricopeptide (TPR) repeat protein